LLVHISDNITKHRMDQRLCQDLRRFGLSLSSPPSPSPSRLSASGVAAAATSARGARHFSTKEASIGSAATLSSPAGTLSRRTALSRTTPSTPGGPRVHAWGARFEDSRIRGAHLRVPTAVPRGLPKCRRPSPIKHVYSDQNTTTTTTTTTTPSNYCF
jgi:hypothetical protein